MRHVDFTAMLAEINRDGFFMKKLNTLKMLTANEQTYLNTEQLIALLNNIADAKLQVVEAMIEKISDLNDENRAAIMRECPAFSVSDKSKLEHMLISQHPKASTPREFKLQTPLSDTDFEAVLTEVRGVHGIQHQIDVLKILVSSERSFLTTRQVIELMHLMPSQKGLVLETLQDKIVDYYLANILALVNECDSFHIIESFIKRVPRREAFAPIEDIQPAMADSEFELILKEISDLKTSKQKVDRLKMYCENAFTYFTCAQVARLMPAANATVSVVEAVKDRVVDFSIANILSLAHHCNTPKGKWDLVTSLIQHHQLPKIHIAESDSPVASASSSNTAAAATAGSTGEHTSGEAAESSTGAAPFTSPPISPRVAATQFISEAEFEEFLNEVKKSKSAKGQLTKIKSFVDQKAAEHANFSTLQVVSLLNSVKSGKYEIAEMMHNRIVDLSVPNLIAIGNTQTTSKGKQKMMDVINGKLTALQIAEAEKAAKADKAAAAASSGAATPADSAE